MPFRASLPVTRQDPESAQAGCGSGTVQDHPRTGQVGCVLQQRNRKTVQVLGTAFRQDFDFTIQVADPAVQAELFGQSMDEWPEPDALDLAGQPPAS